MWGERYELDMALQYYLGKITEYTRKLDDIRFLQLHFAANDFPHYNHQDDYTDITSSSHSQFLLVWMQPEMVPVSICGIFFHP